MIRGSIKLTEIMLKGCTQYSFFKFADHAWKFSQNTRENLLVLSEFGSEFKMQKAESFFLYFRDSLMLFFFSSAFFLSGKTRKLALSLVMRKPFF